MIFNLIYYWLRMFSKSLRKLHNKTTIKVRWSVFHAHKHTLNVHQPIFWLNFSSEITNARSHSNFSFVDTTKAREKSTKKQNESLYSRSKCRLEGNTSNLSQMHTIPYHFQTDKPRNFKWIFNQINIYWVYFRTRSNWQRSVSLNQL